MNPVIQYLLKRFNYFEPKIEVINEELIRINDYKFKIIKWYNRYIYIQTVLDLNDFDSFFWNIYEILDNSIDYEKLKNIFDILIYSHLFKKFINDDFIYDKDLWYEIKDYYSKSGFNVEFDKWNSSKENLVLDKWYKISRIYDHRYWFGIKFKYGNMEIRLKQEYKKISIEFLMDSKLSKYLNFINKSEVPEYENKLFKYPYNDLCIILNEKIEKELEFKYNFIIQSTDLSKILELKNKNFTFLFDNYQELIEEYFNIVELICRSPIISKMFERFKSQEIYNYYYPQYKFGKYLKKCIPELNTRIDDYNLIITVDSNFEYNINLLGVYYNQNSTVIQVPRDLNFDCFKVKLFINEYVSPVLNLTISHKGDITLEIKCSTTNLKDPCLINIYPVVDVDNKPDYINNDFHLN